MRTADFEYVLPADRIAQAPAARRDEARLLVVRRSTGELEHRRVGDLPEYLAAGDLLVANDTRVIPARLIGWKPSGGKVELLFLEEREPGVWEVLLRAARRPRVGAVLRLGPGGERGLLVEDGEKGQAGVRCVVHEENDALPALQTELDQRPGQPVRVGGKAGIGVYRTTALERRFVGEPEGVGEKPVM